MWHTKGTSCKKCVFYACCVLITMCLMCAHTWGCAWGKTLDSGGSNAPSQVLIRQKLVPVAQIKRLRIWDKCASSGKKKRASFNNFRSRLYLPHVRYLFPFRVVDFYEKCLRYCMCFSYNSFLEAGFTSTPTKKISFVVQNAFFGNEFDFSKKLFFCSHLIISRILPPGVAKEWKEQGIGYM